MSRLHARSGTPRKYGDRNAYAKQPTFNPWALLGVICAIVAAAAYVSGAIG